MPSLVSNDGRLVFIHPKKTGGNSVVYSLPDLFTPGPGYPHRTLLELCPGDSARGKFRFMTVRNPWARCASWVRWHGEYGDTRTIREAVDTLVPLVDYGLREMDFLVRCECLAEDFSSLCERIGAGKRELLRLNAVTGEYDYRAMFTPEEASAVGVKFKVDIEHLGYSF